MLTLAKGLRQTAWAPSVVVPEAGKVSERCRDLDVPVFEIPLPPLKRPGIASLSTIRAVRRLLADTASRVVHANGSRAMFYGGVAARRARVPCIWHVRILDKDPVLDTFLVRLAAATISSSRIGLERLERWPWALERCHVVPNGLDLEAFEPSTTRAAVRTELGVDDEDVVVTSVGRLIAEKTPELLIHAMQRAGARSSRLKAFVVGGGAERSRLEARVLSADLDERIRFLGHRDDVADILDASDMFVMTSAIEHFGRVIVEAMCRRLPVIAPAAGGAAEIVVDGHTGILVAPGDGEAFGAAIRLLAEDPSLRLRLGEEGRRRVVDHYSMEKHVEGVVRLYEGLTQDSEG